MSVRSKIRKITIGSNPKDSGMAFQVGGRAGGDSYVISNIIEDNNNFFSFGNVRYLVFISDGKTEFVWKAFEGVPVTIEYFLPTKEYVVIV